MRRLLMGRLYTKLIDPQHAIKFAVQTPGYETRKGSMFHNPALPDRFLKKPVRRDLDSKILSKKLIGDHN